MPIPGATRIETAASFARALALDLDEDDRELLDAAFSGLLLRVPRASRRPNDSAAGDVVLIMGMPGAGKSEIARALEAEGYTRLNRDTLGGSLRDLSSRLTTVLAESQKQVVLDNTYPSRKSRNEVIEVSWQHGVHVRCIWLTTGNADAQINCVRRMLEAHGSLPSPEEIRQLSASDTRYLLPDALFRYERTLESPTLDEGWISIDTRDFVRDAERGEARALILDFDDLRGRDVPALDPADVVVDDARRDILLRHRENGWQIFLHAWRPQIERGQTTPEEVDACFERMREILGNVDVACCPHDAGPPACWCRKPIPGSVLEFAARRDVALTRSVVVGRSAADKTLAERIGAEFTASASFFR